MLILGIETSCDETSASIVEIKRGCFNILSNVISSQIKIHQKYGGVVPELAARKHTENIIPVIDLALSKISPFRKGGLGGFKLDAIAVVAGPGLATSLVVGVETAKTLAWSWKIPLIPINHLEAHIYANWLPNKNFPLTRGGIKFPALCLLVSGGHTELILIKDFGKYKMVGETVDDAAGEAFDKVAKLLNISYPGGPNVAKLAKTGDPNKIVFPRPLINSKDFNFSFSGLKTAVSQKITPPAPLIRGESARRPPDKGGWGVNNICAGFQEAVVDVLVSKTIKAAKKYKVKTIMLAGGVASNEKLRQDMAEKIKLELKKISFIFPEKKFCTDNAAMVAVAGYFNYDKKLKPYGLERVDVDPNLGL
jgi:N6-L-threonylcarbamoyladenine synthase